jgi:polar amino acid transport system substrate-binding protein
MLSRRDFGGGLAAGAAMRRGGSERPAPSPPPNEPNLARILRTKNLRVAGLAGEEPYFYKEPGAGRWSGFCVAMAQNLASALGVEITVTESNWSDLVTDLHLGKIDLAFGPGPTAQRAMFADYATPLFHDAYAIIARKGFAPKSWTEINVPQALIAVDAGSPREEAARRCAGNAAITGFKSRDEALAAIQSGRADCLVTTVLPALALLKRNPQIGELVIPSPQLRAAVCAAVPYDADRRFRGVVDAWSEDNRGTDEIRKWVVAALGTIGIEPSDLPAAVSF